MFPEHPSPFPYLTEMENNLLINLEKNSIYAYWDLTTVTIYISIEIKLASCPLKVVKLFSTV